MSDERTEPSFKDRALFLLSASMAELRRRLASEPISGAEIASAFQPGEFGLGPWPIVRAGGRTFSAIPFAAPRSEAGAVIRIAPLREDPLPQAARRPWRAEISFASSPKEAADLLFERMRLSSARPALPATASVRCF